MGRHSKPEAQEPLSKQELEEKIAGLTKTLRQVFAERARAKEELQAVNDAELQETMRLQALLKELIPTLLDKAVLDDRKIEILFTNKYSKKHRGAKALVSPGLDLAQTLNDLFTELGVTSNLTARAWDSISAGIQAVALDAENAKKMPPGRNFDAAARYIMNESETGKEKGKHYIVITDGDIYGGNIRSIALKLAFLELDPQATMDFVVYSETEKTAIDALVKQVKTKEPVKDRINLVKVRTEGDILDAVKSVIKGHVISRLPPKPEAVVKSTPSFGRRAMHRLLHGQQKMPS